MEPEKQKALIIEEYGKTPVLRDFDVPQPKDG